MVDKAKIGDLREHVSQLQAALEGIIGLMSEVVSPEFMTRAEVTEYVGVNPRTFRRMLQNGGFPPPLSNGKWYRDTVEEWIDGE